MKHTSKELCQSANKLLSNSPNANQVRLAQSVTFTEMIEVTVECCLVTSLSATLGQTEHTHTQVLHVTVPLTHVIQP